MTDTKVMIDGVEVDAAAPIDRTFRDAWVLDANDIIALDPDKVRLKRTALIKAEAQNRILKLIGVDDLTMCIIKQLNANMRANELNDARHERALTEQEQIEAAMLRGLADKIKAVRAASDALEISSPEDYADNKHWPAGA